MTVNVPDSLDALIAYLMSDTDIAALAGDSIWPGEIPQSEVGDMPKYAVNCAWAGQGYEEQHLQKPRMDITCSGPTQKQARSLYLAVYQALINLKRDNSAEALLHNAEQASGPIGGREPNTDWPIVWSSWVLRVSQQKITNE